MEELGRRIYTVCDSRDSDKNQQPFNEERFRQLYVYDPPPESSLTSKVKENLKCDHQSLLNVFPILKWLPRYKKKDFVSDVIAGLTVAIMHISQGMAYALLGGVPPVVGIYMAFFPVIIYIVMGTSRHVSMGTFAVVCMMVGKSVDTYSHVAEVEVNATQWEEVQVGASMSALTPTEVATAVCLVVGLWQVVLSIFRLGSLSVLLSQTLVSGFTTGAAVHVLTSQIGTLLGIKVKRYSGPLKIIYTYVDIFLNVGNLNRLTAALSVCFIALLVVFNIFVKPFLNKICRRDIPLPVEFLVVIIGTILSKSFNLKEEYGLAVVDSVPTGLPKPSLPPLHLLPNLIVDGLIIAIVAISINISMANIFAQKLGYEIEGNQEMLAAGVGNVFSSFFSCMPFAASLSRSLIQEAVGGKTQITNVVSSLSLVFVLLFVGPFFNPLPYCVLSTIIVLALKGMFTQFKDLPTIYRRSKLDGLVWIVTFLSVVILDIDFGLGIGLLASVSSLLLRNQNPEVVTLGRIPGTQIYLDSDRYRKAQILPDVLILQVVGGLHFANSSPVQKEIMLKFVKFRKSLPAVDNSKKSNRSLSLVIDLSCVPFMDPTAVRSLVSVAEEVKTFQSSLLLSGCLPSVYESLERSGFFDTCPRSLVFHGLDDAVEFAKKLQNWGFSEGLTEYISKF